MENLEELKKYIKILDGQDKDRVMSSLRGLTDVEEKYLTPDQKNFIWNYLFPEQLLDYELPSVVQGYLENVGMTRGFQVPNDGMLMLLVRALRTKQYGGFIKHLLHSFLNLDDIFPVSGNGQTTCPICGKPVYEFGAWSTLCNNNPGFGEQDRKEYLAFGSKNSDVCICGNCLVQLQELNKTMGILEPGYLEPRGWKKI